VNDGHIVEVNAEFIRRDLRKRSFLPLPMRRRAGENRDFAGGFDTHSRAFPTAGRHCLRRAKRANLDIAR
jgi:hypothetical protein